MYSETNRRYAARRADDEFLRRMMGGDLSGNAIPTVKTVAGISESERGNRQRISCEGMPLPLAKDAGACRREAFAPSLAMVYSPRQCWHEILDPRRALSEGTLFKELVLPFEAGYKNDKEVRVRRPL